MSSQPLPSDTPDAGSVQAWELGSDLNRSLDAAFAELPRRCVFCNEKVRVTLAGLLPGQGAREFITPCQVFLVVTFGALKVELAEEDRDLVPGQVITIKPNAWLRLSAAKYADFLLVGGNEAGHVGNDLARCLKLSLFSSRN